ncbi:zinc finger protein 77-like isoform X1 [Anopheles merus]|uniref:zinc finger protein 77-like isoform X1 n=1 Tax=Anopheles merus TaxID=30066 RepID=UPI001BE4D910|nr:zinc finger protein 77-like isoform X1 [Anopheles merus]
MESILDEVRCVCRLCLCEGDGVLVPVCKILGLSLTVDDIERCTGVKIAEENSIPYSVCEDCHGKLTLFTTFRTFCLSNDARFRELFAAVFANVPSDDEQSLQEMGSNDKTRPAMDDHIGYIATYVGPTFQSKIAKVEYLEQDDSSSVCSSSKGHNNSDDEDNLAIAVDGNESYGEHPQDRSVSPDGEASEQENDEKASVTDCGRGVDCIGSASDGEDNDEENERTQKNALQDKNSRRQLCPMCGKLVYDLPVHIVSHTKERKHVCPHCSMAYGRKTYLKMHVEAVHLKKVVKTCELCNRGFTQRTGYEAHMRAQHNIGKWYECKLCDMQFRHPGGLREHNNRKHNEKSNCSCPICGMEFQSKVGLKNHSRVHSVVQMFACKHCPKRFKSPNAHKQHELTHLGVTFPCPVCAKTYRYSQNLTAHMRKHKTKDSL